MLALPNRDMGEVGMIAELQMTRRRVRRTWLALALGLMSLGVLAMPSVPYGPATAALHSVQQLAQTR